MLLGLEYGNLSLDRLKYRSVADLANFDEAYKATAPEKVRDMSDEALDMHHRYFVDILPELGRVAGVAWMKPAAEGRIALLSAEIDRRRAERYSTAQHEETMKLGGKTLGVGKKGLSWARIAGVAGIAAVLIAAASLGVQIYFSKNPPSQTVAPSPTSSPQTTATISELPESAASSNSATPSQSPMAETTPTGTP
ncbi:MAG TPA: hypothetical protein VEP30_11665 [Chthoniobacterales bacterium]|nr:hypothetical protein [Chthoniobacterales bacterium]